MIFTSYRATSDEVVCWNWHYDMFVLSSVISGMSSSVTLLVSVKVFIPVCYLLWSSFFIRRERSPRCHCVVSSRFWDHLTFAYFDFRLEFCFVFALSLLWACQFFLWPTESDYSSCLETHGWLWEIYGEVVLDLCVRLLIRSILFVSTWVLLLFYLRRSY